MVVVTKPTGSGEKNTYLARRRRRPVKASRLASVHPWLAYSFNYMWLTKSSLDEAAFTPKTAV